MVVFILLLSVKLGLFVVVVVVVIARPYKLASLVMPMLGLCN